ncbi:MAG: hypothetical protein KDM63_13390, partial [Verrucomicrobiae bacterium]|nr:hypothetical protein [Verrucomicrobiae bacterium]
MNTPTATVDHYQRALEIAAQTAGHGFPPLSRLRRHDGRAYDVESDTTDFGIALLDVTLDVNGNIRLIEANGSNA